MFLAWKKSENESKNGSKITKKRFRATPHQRVEKNTLQTQKMNPKRLKNPRFFHFFLARFGGRGNEQVYSVLFFTVFCEGERHDLSKTGGFFQKISSSWFSKTLAYFFLQIHVNLDCFGGDPGERCIFSWLGPWPSSCFVKNMDMALTSIQDK